MVSINSLFFDWKPVFTDKKLYDRLILFYIFLLFFFQVFDVYATRYLVETQNLREQNPVMRNMMESNPNWALHSLAIKTIFSFGFVYCFLWLSTNQKFWDEKYLKYFIFGITFIVFFLYVFVTGIHILNITSYGGWGELFI